MITIDRIRETLEGVRLLANNERELQDGIAQAFTSAGIPFEREWRLSCRDRVDFYLRDEEIAIEVKVRTSRMALLRQIQRYACFGWVRVVVVVSPRPYDLPETLAGKPIVGIALWRAALS